MDEKFVIGERPDPKAELRQLLEYNGFSYHEEETAFTCRFSDKGMTWETRFLCMDGSVLILGMYPFRVTDRAAAEDFCQEVNRQAVFGSMVWDAEAGRLIFRTGADLFDVYSAYEQLGRMLEYNANIITYFWQLAKNIMEDAEISDENEISEE